MSRKKKLPDFLKSVTFSLKEVSPAGYFNDYTGYWSSLDFDIIVIRDEDESEEKLGSMQIEQFHWSRANNDEFCPHCAFDQYGSCNIDQYAKILWSEEEHELSGLIDYDTEPSNLYILKSINIKPQYRGYDLGKAAIWLFYRNFCAHYDWILLLAFPLQFSIAPEEQEKCAPDEFKGTQKECTKRLVKYYQDLAFERIAKSDFYLFSSTYIMPRPEILDTIQGE